jgi:hypothetical protein
VSVRELLRPPPHRGPLIAAGAVPLAVGIALEELRLSGSFSRSGHTLIVLLVGALVYWLGVQAPNEDGGPPAYQSVLLVTGILLLYGALLTGAHGFAFAGNPGQVAWTSAAAAVLALWPAFARRSALCLLIGAILVGLTLAFLVRWAFDPRSAAPYRWLLLAYAGGLVLGSLAVRDTLPRHAEQLINAAGLAVAAIGVTAVLASPVGPQRAVQLLPGFWEAVLLAAGFGLLAFGALERSPGPAYMGALNTALFVAAVYPSGEPTLYWWPLVLILVGGALLVAGLRPRRPLPAQPAPHTAGDAPPAARVEDAEIVIRVRDDSR